MSSRWLIAGAALVGVLLVGSIVVGLTQRAEEFPEDSPEAAVQQLLRAAEEEDFGAAHAMLSAGLRAQCSLDAFGGGPYGRKSELNDSRVTLQNTQALNGSIVVIARVTRIRSSGPFSTSESSHEQRYTLSWDGDEWRFTQYPWPYYGCPARAEVGPSAVETRPEGTPEGAVQRYLAAVGAQDLTQAYEYLAEEYREQCGVDAFSEGGVAGSSEINRSVVTFDPTTFDRGTAFVSARLTQFATAERLGEPVASFSVAFLLHMEGSQWRFSEPPWPTYECGESVFEQ